MHLFSSKIRVRSHAFPPAWSCLSSRASLPPQSHGVTSSPRIFSCGFALFFNWGGPRGVLMGTKVLSQAGTSIRPFMTPSINWLNFAEKRVVRGVFCPSHSLWEDVQQFQRSGPSTIKSICGWVCTHLHLCSCAFQFKWCFPLPGVFPWVCF